MDDIQLDLDESLYFDFNFDLPCLPQEGFPTPDETPFNTLHETTSSRRGQVRTSLACIACRSKHVKCDARAPACSGCERENKPCKYTKSRRGGQTKAAILQRRAANQASNWNANIEAAATGVRPPRSVTTTASSSYSVVATPYGSDQSFGARQSSCHQDDSKTRSEMLLDLYYEFFHVPHPWALPRESLNRRLENDPQSLQHIILVLEYIGSKHCPKSGSNNLQERVSNALNNTDGIPSSPFSVQALLLFAVATHCENDFEAARLLIDRAISMALALGMQSRKFTDEYGEGDPVLEESWRRTWWALYLTDSQFSGVRRYTWFSLWSVDSDVELPCEEECYERAVIPQPRTLEEYDSRELAEKELSFSSFTYLIDAGRISGTVLAVGYETRKPFDPAVTTADTKLTNWQLHLPKAKEEVMDSNGKVDEIMFQAHLGINILKIYLHRPRSRLAYSDSEGVAKCTPPPTQDRMTATRENALAFHTTKALEGVEALLNLFALPTPIIGHSPMSFCGVAMAIMGQLSACKNVLDAPNTLAGRERIRLGIGALKIYIEIWPLACQTLAEVKCIARGLLST